MDQTRCRVIDFPEFSSEKCKSLFQRWNVIQFFLIDSYRVVKILRFIFDYHKRARTFTNTGSI